ncbi:hypothetical protein Tco_0385796 [Tanacetum coccineum]
MSTPPVIAAVIDLSFPKPSSQVTPLPINTEATSITTTLPEITLFIALQLRVGKLEQDMSEVKKTDHSATVLDSIKSQVPTVHENLKLITDERVIEDNPKSHSGSMLSMKNLEDTDNFGDQFLYDKPTEDD